MLDMTDVCMTAPSSGDPRQCSSHLDSLLLLVVGARVSSGRAKSASVPPVQGAVARWM